MKKRFITSLWGILLIVAIFTFPIGAILWIITGFNLFSYLFESTVEAEQERLKTQI